MKVAILADDLIWSSRLADHLRAAGAEPVTVRSIAGLERALDGVDAVLVDLTARAYDAVEGVRAGAAAGRRVLAVGQHADPALRRRAMTAGAERVHTYRKLFEDGPATLGAWLR